MPQTVRGVIARAKGEPVTVENIVIPDPGPGEVVVDIEACGVCHTDLHYREGGIVERRSRAEGMDSRGCDPRVDMRGCACRRDRCE